MICHFKYFKYFTVGFLLGNVDGVKESNHKKYNILRVTEYYSELRGLLSVSGCHEYQLRKKTSSTDERCHFR